jgi:hypothetical protein
MAVQYSFCGEATPLCFSLMKGVMVGDVIGKSTGKRVSLVF